MPDLFPMFSDVPATLELPLYRDAAWDFEKGCPIFDNGNPLKVEGLEAIKVWIYKALLTLRGKYEIYSFNYGCDASNLIGQHYTEGTKRAEVIRYIKEALLVSPYIREAEATDIEFIGDRLSVLVRCDTVYGGVTVNV